MTVLCTLILHIANTPRPILLLESKGSTITSVRAKP